MSLKVSNSEQINTHSRLNNSQGVSYRPHALQSKNDEYVKKDKSNDGKFSFTQALNNFGKGLVSPVTAMFSSPKNFLLGAGMIAGSMALIMATAGAAAPILLAVGVVGGVIQAGSGAAKIIDAKNGDDVEKAFYDLGGATTTLGLSAWGAKPALRQANLRQDNLSSLSAVKKCFISSKDLAKESFEVFKSGYYKTNFENAYRIIKQPGILKRYARKINRFGENNFEYSFAKFKEALPEKFAKLVKGRNKSELSIYAKLVKERTATIDSQIEKINQNGKLSSSAKQAKIKDLIHEREKIASDYKFAKKKIEDLFGARITFEDASPKNIKQFFNSLEKAVKKGDLEILEIENYRGANKNFKGENDFYIDAEYLEALAERIGIDFSNKTKPSGYTGINLKVKPKHGQVFELQIRGKEIDAFAEIEHIPYDLRQGKDIANGNNKAGILLAKIQKAIKKLDAKTYQKYEEYIYDNYIHAQAVELGKSSTKPAIPDGIDPILRIENLKEVGKQAKIHGSCEIKNPLDFYAKATFISGVQGVRNEH